MSLHYSTMRLFTSIRDTTVRLFTSLGRSPREASDESEEIAQAEQAEESVAGSQRDPSTADATRAGLLGLSRSDRRNLARNVAISRAMASLETDTEGEPRQTELNGSSQDEGDPLGSLLLTLLNLAVEDEDGA